MISDDEILKRPFTPSSERDMPIFEIGGASCVYTINVRTCTCILRQSFDIQLSGNPNAVIISYIENIDRLERIRNPNLSVVIGICTSFATILHNLADKTRILWGERSDRGTFEHSRIGRIVLRQSISVSCATVP